MAEYRYLLRDVITGDLLGEVPFESATYGDVLNAPGAFSGTLGLQQPTKLQGVLSSALSLMDQGRLTAFVERNGVLVWCGFLWTSDCDMEAGTCVLAGEGYHSYFRRRLILADKTYTQIDQTLIAKDLIDYGQAAFYAYNGVGVLTSGVVASGVLRDRAYLSVETKGLGEAIEQLASVEGGFDFRFEPRWNGAAIEVRFLTSYPDTGRSTDYVFDLGTQITKLRIQRDATSLANRVIGIGATPDGGTSPLTASAIDLASLSSMPLFDDVVNVTDVSDVLTLGQHANKRLTRGKTAIVIPDVDVDPTQDPTLGSYFVGDNVRLRGSVGVESLDGMFRITERSVGVDDNGSESAALTFANLEVFSS